eukprot:7124528-Prymnesium_polylepis.1
MRPQGCCRWRCRRLPRGIRVSLWVGLDVTRLDRLLLVAVVIVDRARPVSVDCDHHARVPARAAAKACPHTLACHERRPALGL